jgi:hypothetical protein
VNFHTKNPIMPRSATPPATDRPMMEPVPRPESGAGDEEVWVGLAEEVPAVKVWITVDV